MPPKNLLERIVMASRHPTRWHVVDVPRECRPMIESASNSHLVTFPIAIDDAGILPAFLQIGPTIPVRFGLLLPGAPGREHLFDLLRLSPPRRPISPNTWLNFLPNLLARGTSPEAARRINLARSIVSLIVLQAGYPNVRWRAFGPQIFFAKGPEDPFPLHATGSILPVPPLRVLLADTLLPDPAAPEPKPWGDAADHLEGYTLDASAHVRVALLAKIADDARLILGPRRATRLLKALRP